MEELLIQETGELFRAVQTSGIFEDSKTFVDAIPKDEPEAILKSFLAKRDQPEFDLLEFIKHHFYLPDPVPIAERRHPTMQRYIEASWDTLTMDMTEGGGLSTLLLAGYPHLVPGDRFREPYYWDSAFMFECLLTFERHEKRAMQILYNMEELLRVFGHIPNGFRTYYLTRSQPPMLTRMSRAYRKHVEKSKHRDDNGCRRIQSELKDAIADRIIDPIAKRPSDDTLFRRMLESEYSYWMRGESICGQKVAREHVVMYGNHVLNRYWDASDKPRPESYAEDAHTAREIGVSDPKHLFRNLRAAAESGWDFSSRWLGDRQKLSTIRTTKIIPVDLNALLYSAERELSILLADEGQTEAAERYEEMAEQRREAVNDLCWNEQTGFFYDFDWEKEEQTPVESLAAVFPLTCEMASDHQAESIRKRIERDFLKEGGLVATLTEGTGQQWDYPNAWAPLQFAAVQGLRTYARQTEYSDPFFRLAFQIAARFHKCAREYFDQTGYMMEKYNAVSPELVGAGGEYKPQAGFGWTNAIVMYFQRFLEDHTPELYNRTTAHHR